MATARGPLDPRIVGGDPGNATCSFNSPGIGTVFFPSFIATLGIGKYDGISKIQTTRHHITYKNTHAIVGSGATEAPMGYDTLLAEYQDEAQKRYTEEYSMLCFLAGISALFPQTDTVAIKFGTGAPVSLYQAYEEQIKKRYLGEHCYTYNGHNRRIVVSDVGVFGECREFLRLLPPNERLGRVMGYDIGGRTLNVVMWQDGEVIGQRTYDMGIDKLLVNIPSVSGDPLARLKMHQSIRSGSKTHSRSQAELENRLAGALKVVGRKFPIDTAERHIVGGGGAFGMANVLRGLYEKTATIQILNGDKPETANAAAYAAAMSEA